MPSADADVVPPRRRRLVIAGRGVDEHVYVRSRDVSLSGPRWGEWVDIGGVSTATPAMERTDDGLVRVFARSADRTISVNAESLCFLPM